MTEPRRTPLFDLQPGVAAPWEWIVVGFVTLASVLYWVAHFHTFTIPSPDTYSYIDTSRELWDGDLPDSFKRMPLFPALIGLIAKLLPGPEPEIDAALVLNIACAAGSLLLLYAIARRFTAWAAMVPVALVATATETHLVVGQPILDALVGFLVLLCVWLFLRRSRWLHVAMFLLALTRYECAAMIGVVFLADAISQRRLWRPLVLAIAAGSGCALWMYLSLTHARAGASNPYLDEMKSMGWTVNATFAERSLEVSFQRTDLLPWAALAIFGVAATLRRRADRVASSVILGFFALYVIGHIAFSVVIDRYVYPIAWVLPLYGAVGLETAIDWLRTRTVPRARPWHGPVIAAIVGGVALLVVISALQLIRSRGGVASRFVYEGLPVCVLVATFGLVQLGRGARPVWTSLAAGFVLVAALGRQAEVGTFRHVNSSWKQRYKHYDSYLTGIWLRDHLADGEKAVVAYGTLAGKFAHMSSKRLVSPRKLRSQSFEELHAELASRGIVYVVWQYYKLPDDARRAQNQWKRYRPDLFDRFARGDPVPGFQLVTTLDLPDKAKRADVQIYRLVSAE